MAKYKIKGNMCSCSKARLEDSLAGMENCRMNQDTIEAPEELEQRLSQAVSQAGGSLERMESSPVPTGESTIGSSKTCVLINLVAPSKPIHEIIVLIISAAMLALGLIIDPGYPMNLIVLLLPYLICGWPVIKKAGLNIWHKQFFTEFTLMSIATLAAIALGQMAEALAVMLFYQTGEFFQERAAERSRGSIKALLASKPSIAQVLQDGQLRDMLVEFIQPGATVVVLAGQIIPLDGVILSGQAQVDTSPLTGEPVPLAAGPGTQLLAGSICLDGLLTIRVSARFQDSQLAWVLEMVEQASARKSKVERFMSRLAAIYTPIVFAAALLVAVLPPLITGAEFSTWIYRALVLLVVSCPCALVISIPLGYFAGIGAAASQGILVKGGYVLDGLRRIKAVAFDKTGTLTLGVFQVNNLQTANNASQAELVLAALMAQSGSSHPLASAVRHKARLLGLDLPALSDITSRETPGQGVSAQYEGQTYLAGSREWQEHNNIDCQPNDWPGSIIYVAQNSRFLGGIQVSDHIKPSAGQAIARLKAMGLKTYMLSGDRRQSAAWVAEELKLDDFRAGLLPAEKMRALDELTGLDNAMFVGDGINDAPLLAASRVSMAMGGLGSAAAIESADAVALNDDPLKVPVLLKLGQATRAIIWQNIIFALGIKALFMVLGILGLANLWEAVFADVGVALLAVLNATRMLGQRRALHH